MADSTVTNTFIGPSDGWVQVAATAATFLRVSAFPHTHPFYLYFGTSAPSLLRTPGTGTITFSTGVPTAGQTTTIGTEVYTWRAAASLPFEVTIGADETAAATNFTTIVNAQSQLVTASRATLVVTLTTKAVGSTNNIALSTTAAHTAASGAALTGASEQTLGALICHKPFQSNVLTSKACWVRVKNPVPNSPNSDGKLRIDTVVFS